MQSTPKVWTLDTPYSIHVPSFAEGKPTFEKDTDPWVALFEEQLEADKEACDVLKDGIQNLLTFTGLFSAVVTTFVVDSYKNLQPDTGELSVTLLAQIASRLDPNAPANTVSIAPIQEFTAAGSTIRINACWFLSLVISIGTATAAITTLQWIREFQRYDKNNLTSKQAFALRNMRAEAFRNWKVHAIISALPFLIQVALVLFLLGLADFLFSISPLVVAIPSTIAATTTFAFVTATIALPTAHHLWAMAKYFRQPHGIPAPCPYKSPTGWSLFQITHRILATIIPPLRAASRLPFLLIDLLSGTPHDHGQLKHEGSKWRACIKQHFSQDMLTKSLNRVPYVSPWDTELEWLLRRSDPNPPSDASDSIESSDPLNSSQQKGFSVEYDAICALASMAEQSFRGPSPLSFAIHECFLKMLPHLKDDFISARGGRKANLNQLLGVQAIKTGLNLLYDNLDPKLIQAQQLMFFLDAFEETRTTSLNHPFTTHQLELCTRILAEVFTGTSPPLKPSAASASLSAGSDDLWLPEILLDTDSITQLSHITQGEAFREQIILIFENFVLSSITSRPLAPIGEFHTFRQVFPLTGLATRTLYDTLRLMDATSSHSSDQSTSVPTTQSRRDIVEITGSSIHRLLIRFLESYHDPTTLQDFASRADATTSRSTVLTSRASRSHQEHGTSRSRQPKPFHTTTLYLLSTVYIAQLLDCLKHFGYRDLQCLRDRTQSFAPEFISSFIDLLDAWLGASGLSDFKIFGTRKYLARTKGEVRGLCTGPGSGGKFTWTMPGNTELDPGGSPSMAPGRRSSVVIEIEEASPKAESIHYDPDKFA